MKIKIHVYYPLSIPSKMVGIIMRKETQCAITVKSAFCAIEAEVLQ